MSNHRYSPGIKGEAVRQIIEAGHSVSEVATRLGVSTNSLHKCVKAIRPDCPSRLFIRARKSCCLANVFMMQTANTFEFYDSALIRRLFPTSFRRVFAQGKVRSGLIVVTDEARDNASKVTFAQHNHVI